MFLCSRPVELACCEDYDEDLVAGEGGGSRALPSRALVARGGCISSTVSDIPLGYAFGRLAIASGSASDGDDPKVFKATDFGLGC